MIAADANFSQSTLSSLQTKKFLFQKKFLNESKKRIFNKASFTLLEDKCCRHGADDVGDVSAVGGARRL